MMRRRIERVVQKRPGHLPAVALRGLRQAGKTVTRCLDLTVDVMLARREGGGAARALTSPVVEDNHSCV
jgi:predicted AAA+ superfamily ATPase